MTKPCLVPIKTRHENNAYFAVRTVATLDRVYYAMVTVRDPIDAQLWAPIRWVMRHRCFLEVTR